MSAESGAAPNPSPVVYHSTPPVSDRDSATFEQVPAELEQTPAATSRFVTNVLWSWLAVAFALVSGVFLSPYVIHRLGDERYGIWALAFSFVDYFVLVDFGFRSAIVKYTAHYRATREFDRLEELVSTALAYFAVAGAIILGASILLSWNVTRLFNVLPRDASDLRFLTVTVGLGCALTVAFSAWTAVFDGYQRFDVSSLILMVNNAIRVVGTFALLYAGFGLKAMGLCILAGQVTGFILTYGSLRRLLPVRIFAPRRASFAALRQMFGYGSRTLVANVSLVVLNQGAPGLIGHFLSTAFVGYYAFPLRLISYPVEMVGRLGMVTGAKAAELSAHGDLRAISRMALIVNRYCLMLFFVVPVYLTIFGHQLLQVWISPNFAAQSAPLLPILGAGLTIGIAAQYNSTSILYGLAKHGSLARAVFIEAIVCVAGLWYVIPRYGVFGAACVGAGLTIVSRGIYVPYKVSCHLEMRYSSYLWGIYAKPLAIMTPVAAITWGINRMLGEPAAWKVVLGGGAAMAIVYYLLVFFQGLEREHRQMILSGIAAARRKLAGLFLSRAAGLS